MYKCISINGKHGGSLTVLNKSIDYSQLPENIKNTAVISSYAVVSITDTGCGMTKEILNKVFDPFFTTKNSQEGTGLGLSVVNKILLSHGGFVDVKSEVGIGSCFTIYLPITDILVEQKTNSSEALIDSRPISVMIVDDEIRVVKYLKKRLIKKGFQLNVFTDAEEALNLFNQSPNKWDILIVDYTMPKYKGTVFAQQVKKQRPNIPIILITDLVEKEALQMKQIKVLNDILVKPLDFDELLQTIIRLVT